MKVQQLTTLFGLVAAAVSMGEKANAVTTGDSENTELIGCDVNATVTQIEAIWLKIEDTANCTGSVDTCEEIKDFANATTYDPEYGVTQETLDAILSNCSGTSFFATILSVQPGASSNVTELEYEGAYLCQKYSSIPNVTAADCNETIDNMTLDTFYGTMVNALYYKYDSNGTRLEIECPFPQTQCQKTITEVEAIIA